MAVVSLAQVQQWLEQTKLALTVVDAELEATAFTYVKSRLAADYDVTTWTNDTNSPSLVKQIVSMLIAAWLYQRAYSEDASRSNWYGRWLESKAESLLDGLVKGEIDLTDVPGTITAAGLAFYPTDLTGSSEIYDGNGVLVGVAGSEDIKFYMGARF